ncbi:MAG: hypothetical protein WC261_12610 [Synergistaceae bacterium]|jgi:hypothetical protein
MAYRKWQKKKIGLSIEELTEQEVQTRMLNRANKGRCGYVPHFYGAHSGLTGARIGELIAHNIPDDAYGVEWDLSDSSSELTRIGQAAGMDSDDFDLIEPFASIERMTLDSDGNWIASFGDAGFVEDGTAGDVVSRFKKFWWFGYYSSDDQKARLYISPEKMPGFVPFDSFMAGGQELEEIYLGAYEGAVQKISDSSWIEDASDGSNPIQIATLDLPDHMLRSVSGRKPKSNQTLPEFRTMAENRGAGWGLVDLKQAGMVNLLYLIKYADFNAQTQIGQGITGKSSGTGNESELTGATALLGAVDTGGTNLEAVSLFGLENWWGNIWEFTDGGGIKSDGFYVAPDRPYNNTLNGYTRIPCSPPATGGYLKDFYWMQDSKGLFLPKSVQTDVPSASKYVCDYLYTPAAYTTNCFLRGGYWAYGSDAGPFYWSLVDSFATRYQAFGARACFVPTV